MSDDTGRVTTVKALYSASEAFNEIRALRAENERLRKALEDYKTAHEAEVWCRLTAARDEAYERAAKVVDEYPVSHVDGEYVERARRITLNFAAAEIRAMKGKP